MKKLLLALCIVFALSFAAHSGTFGIKFKQVNATDGYVWELAKNDVKFTSVPYVAGQTEYRYDFAGMVVSKTDVFSIRTVNNGIPSSWVSGSINIPDPPTDVEFYYEEAE